jgi:hypothetical protein
MPHAQCRNEADDVVGLNVMWCMTIVETNVTAVRNIPAKRRSREHRDAGPLNH